jgi:hypothetical protein
MGFVPVWGVFNTMSVRGALVVHNLFRIFGRCHRLFCIVRDSSQAQNDIRSCVILRSNDEESVAATNGLFDVVLSD